MCPGLGTNTKTDVKLYEMVHKHKVWFWHAPTWPPCENGHVSCGVFLKLVLQQNHLVSEIPHHKGKTLLHWSGSTVLAP